MTPDLSRARSAGAAMCSRAASTDPESLSLPFESDGLLIPVSLTLSRGLVVAGVASVLLLAAPDHALAQCAMCRAALEQNTEVAAGFNNAILFLLATPYAVFASGAGYVLFTRHRRKSRRDQEYDSSHSPAELPVEPAR